MIFISKIIGIISCTVVYLCLANVIQAQDKMGPDPCADRKGGQPKLLRCGTDTQPSTDTVNGEVLRLEGDNYLVQGLDGKEVRLHLDPTTQVMGVINRGDYIEAKMGAVNDQQHVQSIREIKK
jgi:hypothetical protein